MSSAESRLKRNNKVQLRQAAGVVRSADSESKQGSHAESLLAAEKRTLEMIADGASRKEVLNDLCSCIDGEASPKRTAFRCGSRLGIYRLKDVV